MKLDNGSHLPERTDDEPRRCSYRGFSCLVTTSVHVVKVKICAPDDAPAGLGKAVTIKAHLKGYPKISAAKILQVDVDHVYRLSTDVSLVDNEELTVNPGDQSFSRQP